MLSRLDERLWTVIIILVIFYIAIRMFLIWLWEKLFGGID